MLENIFKKKLILLLIVIGVLVTTLTFIYFKKEIIEEKVTPVPVESGIEVYVHGNKLLEGEENFIVTDTLIPVIEIKNKKSGDLIYISLDQSPNILEDTLSQIEAKPTEDGVLIHTPYALSPGKHNIDIIVTVNRNDISKNFSFILLIKDNFGLSLDKSKLWVIPKSTRESHEKSWYIENNLLKMDSLPPGPHASLAFLYVFDGDVTIDFSLSPLSDVINLVVYFLESERSIIIGDGNNYVIGIIYDGEAKQGDDFLIRPGHRYRVRVIRDGFTYKLFLEEIGDKVTDEVIGIFSDTEPVLTFVDEDASRENDHIGFTLWGGSGGIEISHVVITGYAIY